MLREFYSADDSIEIIKNKEDKEIRKFFVIKNIDNLFYM